MKEYNINDLMEQLKNLERAINDKTDKYNKLKEEYELTGYYDKEYMKICPICGELLFIEADKCPVCRINFRK